MSGRPAVLDVRGLTVRFPAGERDALHEVSLEIAAGSFLSVAGRNGAGKSTLCLAAAGLLPRVIRADVRGFVAGASPTGLVLADPAAGLTGARATVRDEVAFGLENLGVPRAAMDGRIDCSLAALDIDALAARAPESLSGGEQQRVAIAAALAMEPQLLVLDEAAAELDLAASIALGELLARLATGGTAILAADHARPILRRADRMAVLDRGELAAIGPPSEVMAHPVLAAPAVEVVAWVPVRGVRPPRVELHDVTYRYPTGIEALRNVSLTIPPGQAVAIVGGNGSGKSTLAKHLVGLLHPTNGSVTIDGRQIRSVEDAAREVGFLFQDPRDQLFGRTVEHAVAFGPRNLGLPDAQVRALVEAALAALGLTNRRSENPHDLDLAARKQAALAGVLAMDPGLLVLDEPTTGQDRPGLARVEGVLAGLRAAGRTVVAITHDLELAGRAFDRVVALRDGEVVEDGPPAEILGRDRA
jgi:energy-coupling factor transporter ATP-binding protein EcfA2